MPNPNDKAFDWMLDFNQEEDLFSQPLSTGVQIDEEQFASQEYQRQLLGLSYKDVEGTEKEKDWLDLQGQLHGIVSEDTRSTIQKKADEFYESGPIGATAAAVADLLPGIPFVDIIDPPSELPGKGMQEARNILGGLGMLGGLYKTPQAVGRVATNIRQPWSYEDSLGIIKENLGFGLYHLDIVPGTVLKGVKRGIKSIVKDEPLYDKGVVSFAEEAREYLYRRSFGLKPRKGKDIFVENVDGTLSFNPKSKGGKSLAKEILRPDFIDDPRHPLSPHSVMGGYTRKELGKGKVSYEDIWDFKMNPSDWSGLFDLIKVSRGSGRLGSYTRRRVGEAALRSLVHMMTKPPHIKGVVEPKIPSWMKYEGGELVYSP